MATMIFSGDAAAYALAEHVGNGNAQRFLGVMNARAEEVGLRETGFENPVGFDARGHHTSARDLAEVTAWRWRTRPFERWSRPSTRASPRRTGRYPLPTRTSCS
jgi:D-alanyl-D-alanine carboxypeptidase